MLPLDPTRVVDSTSPTKPPPTRSLMYLMVGDDRA